MYSVSSFTDTAAYKEYLVRIYSWICSGRDTGSAIAIRKSVTCK